MTESFSFDDNDIIFGNFQLETLPRLFQTIKLNPYIKMTNNKYLITAKRT